MAPVAVDHFTDPFSPWCWAAQPTLRRLRYAFDDVEWTPRMTVLLPADALPDGVADGGALRERWARAARATGMPVADELWPDRLPDSRPACAAVAFLRETAPDRALPALRRLREAAFVEGRAVDDPGAVATLVAEDEGVDRGPVERALEDGRAAEALAADLRLAVEVAGRLDAVEVRGDVSTLPAAPRLGSAAAAESWRESVGAGAAEGDADDGDAGEPVLVGPPALRVAGEAVTVADARLTFGRLASALGRSVPRTGIDVEDKYATGRMAMHVGRETAESLSGRDFAGLIRPYLARFGSAYIPEVVAGTGLSRETCRSTLASLVEAGELERTGAAQWRTLHDPGDRHGDT